MKDHDFTEVVFKNRNKKYGAYFLRKNYNKHLIISIIISVICCCSVVLIIYFHNIKKPYNFGTIRGTKYVGLFAEQLDLPKVKNSSFQNSEMMTSIPIIVKDKPSKSTLNEKENENIYQYKDYNKSTNFGSLESLPTFQGGDLQKFANWIVSNIKYPEEARKNKEQGSFNIIFVIEKDGSVTNVKVESNAARSIDREIKRVISSSPKWSPGIAFGKPVRVKCEFPMTFTIK